MQPAPSAEEGDHDVTPRPDPTAMTSKQLFVAIDGVKELMRAEIHGRAELVDSRFEAIDRANELLQKIMDAQPGISEKLLSSLRELHGEKFNSIQTQFLERDTRAEQTSRDSKVAVDAALQAAKEAVGKSQEASDRAVAKQEMATTKLLEQITALIASNNRSLDDKANDLKDRLNRIEGSTVGHKEATSGTLAMVGIGIGLIGLLFGYGLTSRTNPAPAPVVAMIPSVSDAQQSAQIAALTRLLEQHLAPPASK